MSTPATWKYWLLAIRPKTLTIAVVPVLVGSTLAWTNNGVMLWSVLIVALLAALFIQAGTNLHNDAADFQRGADHSATRLGPARATAQGWLSAASVHRGAAVSFTTAAVLGLYLTWQGGWPILAVGLASIAAGLAYTGGPKPVAYSSLGEFFVWLFFGLVAVTGSYYLQTGHLNSPVMLLGALVGMPAAAVLVVNNYRDLDNDRQVGKNTLAVQWGRRASQIEYLLLMGLPFVLLPLLTWMGIKGFGWLLPYLTLPWAIQLVRRFHRETPGPVFNQLLAGTARFQLAWGLLLCIGLLLGKLAS
ncbi:MAG: 1,4-dihydroxy-2-naphthoate polyprenyltransferase [Gammaproteobacteria bacterium]|nr:1,4-dihydroxy-2-naphthoate polyprenyltransferase [Gammaproteobacteria bacterium]MCP5458641.1 1,4-dihydroxy-2-naphthoate polyprenyltransferase [Gammaproteobacteria bacterium]